MEELWVEENPSTKRNTLLIFLIRSHDFLLLDELTPVISMSRDVRVFQHFLHIWIQRLVL